MAWGGPAARTRRRSAHNAAQTDGATMEADMQVFLSWSGAASQAAAKALQQSIQRCFDGVEVWMSAVNIRPGQEWFPELREALAKSRFAIICLTHYNRQSAWVMFEAGAIAATFKGVRMVPLVLDGAKTDVEEPLSRFQGVAFGKEDLRQVFQSVNESLGRQLTPSTLDASFEREWRKLQPAVRKALTLEPAYDVFLSVPMAALDTEARYQAFRNEAMKVVNALEQRCGLRVYCALRDIPTMKAFDTGGAAANDDLAMLERSAHFVMLYPEKLATSALFEAGYALARGLPCRFFVRDQSQDAHKLPYLMRKLTEAYSHVSIVDHTEWSSYDDIADCLFRNRKRWFGAPLTARRLNA